MKKVYNKETRNEEGVYYRKGDWGIEVDDDFNKPNFTETTPPQESLEDSCPCDWNEDTNAWILDVAAAEKIEAEKGLEETDIPTVRVVEDLVTLLIGKNVITEEELPPQAVQKLNERKQWRTKL